MYFNVHTQTRYHEGLNQVCIALLFPFPVLDVKTAYFNQDRIIYMNISHNLPLMTFWLWSLFQIFRAEAAVK